MAPTFGSISRSALRTTAINVTSSSGAICFVPFTRWASSVPGATLLGAAVIAWAIDAGAAIANDVWGLQRDREMADIVAACGTPVIVMHNRDRVDARIDIMQDIAAFFARSIEIATRAGISNVYDAARYVTARLKHTSN